MPPVDRDVNVDFDHASFAHFSIGCERCPFGRDVWHRFKDGLRPRAAALWRPLHGESLIPGIVKRSLRNDDSGMPRIPLRCTDYRPSQLPHSSVQWKPTSHIGKAAVPTNRVRNSGWIRCSETSLACHCW